MLLLIAIFTRCQKQELQICATGQLVQECKDWLMHSKRWVLHLKMLKPLMLTIEFLRQFTMQPWKLQLNQPRNLVLMRHLKDHPCRKVSFNLISGEQNLIPTGMIGNYYARMSSDMELETVYQLHRCPRQAPVKFLVIMNHLSLSLPIYIPDVFFQENLFVSTNIQ